MLSKKHFNGKKTNKIILLTDGYGITPPKDITDFIENQYNKGIEFSTVGMGEDYNQSLLELIARKGNGDNFHVASSEVLPDALLSQFGRYIAKDLRVEVYHDEKLIFSNLHGYPVKSKTNKKVTFDIKNVGQGTNHLAFLKFKLEEPSASIEAKPLIVKLRYFDLIKNKEVSYEEKISLNWTEETNTELLLQEEEKKLYAIAIMNQSLKLMAEAHGAGEAKKAEKAVRKGIKQIKEIYPDKKPEEVRLIFEEMNRYAQAFVLWAKNKNK